MALVSSPAALLPWIFNTVLHLLRMFDMVHNGKVGKVGVC